MKSTIQLFLVAAIIGAVLAAPAAAATSQGLEYAVKEGDRFNFLLEMESETSSVSERLYIVVAGVPTIPNAMTVWTELMQIGFDVFWANGTAIFWMILPFIFYPITEYVSHQICVPTGNYELLSELLLDTYTEKVTTTNGYYYWGAKYISMDAGYAVQVTLMYLKSDGFLASYTVTHTNGTDTTFTQSMVRDGLPSDIQVLIMDNLLFIGIGVVVLVIIGVVVCKKR